MRIGVMLRAWDRDGGVGIYTRNIVKHLLRLDREHQYVLMYNDGRHLGTFAAHENVQEVLIPAANPVVWDQWRVPGLLRRHRIDLVFNTKFSVPLATRARRVMMLHGSVWMNHPELVGWFDRLYTRIMMPVYCRSADLLLSNSELTTGDYRRRYRLPAEKIRTIHLAAGEGFVPVADVGRLDAARRRYGLPQRFIVHVGSYDPRKNFVTLIRAFGRVHREVEVPLVVLGKDCHRYAEEADLAALGVEGAVHFPGWVDQDDLPAIYSLASLLLFPSVYEEFGIPVVEAMACGCPVVTADTGAMQEVTAGAALLADPFDDAALARHAVSILSDPAVAEAQRARGLDRARAFSWDAAARATLDALNHVLASR